LPHLWHQRREIQKRKTISNEALDSKLTYDLGEPSLGDIIKSKLRRG